MLGTVATLVRRVTWRKSPLAPVAGFGVAVDAEAVADDAMPLIMDCREERHADGWCGDAMMAAHAERAAMRGLVLPSYRTYEDFAAMVARCTVALRPEPVAEPEPKPEFAPELSPDAAASRFLAWMQDGIGDEPRTFGSDDLSAAYAEFCVDQNLTPTPENKMRAALALMDGVTRVQKNSKANGKRVRTFMWTIAPVSEPAPFDLPIQVAA